MLKVVIKKNGIESAGAQFETQAEADAWLQKGKAGRWWGKPAGFYPLSQLSESELAQEISRITENEMGPLMEPQIEIPSQYSFEITDITQELAAKQLEQEGLNRQALGASIIAKVWAINESKQISPEQFNAILNDESLARIERLLWTGSLKTAKLLISNLDATYFTLEEKQSILNLLETY